VGIELKKVVLFGWEVERFDLSCFEGMKRKDLNGVFIVREIIQRSSEESSARW